MSDDDLTHRRPIPAFLVALDRAATPADKENVLFRFAATLDAVFYDAPCAALSSSATRAGATTEAEVRALLEAAFTTLHLAVAPQYAVEPPARFAALRALGAFVHGSTPVPSVLSEDWTHPHVPLYLAAMRLLMQLFDRGSTQYVFAIRCLSVLAIQAMQVLSPPSAVDAAVTSILSSPSRHGDFASGGGGGSSPQRLDSSALHVSAASPSASIIVGGGAGAGAGAMPSGTPLRSQHGDVGDSFSAAAGSASRESRAPFLNFASLHMDHLLKDPVLRPLVIELWRLWDSAGIDVRVFTACPQAIHAYMPGRLLSSVGCVFRDFVTCPERPKLDKPWSGMCGIHVKTNIGLRSEVMYRVLVEGYNYGVNCPILSEIVGCAKRHWDQPGGGDAAEAAKMCRDYADGCVSSQYFSEDGFLVVRLNARSFFGVGFTASAWMVFHGHGAGFGIEAEVFHQEHDL